MILLLLLWKIKFHESLSPQAIRAQEKIAFREAAALRWIVLDNRVTNRLEPPDQLALREKKRKTKGYLIKTWI